MPSTKEIKGRIKSVKNTSKITKAMELISTVKMKKAQDAVLSSRPFALQALEMLAKIGFSSSSGQSSTGWLYGPEETKGRDLVILISSNKGLCGGYNIGGFKEVLKYKKMNPEKELDFISVGKKARDFIIRTGGNLLLDFSEAIKDNISIKDSKTVSKTVQTYFKNLEYDRVIVVYNFYISAITQKAVSKHFLGLGKNKNEIISFLESIAGKKISDFEEKSSYEFEPSIDEFLNETIPMILDLLFYEILLEAKASEHASRMVAMKNAKDSANKKTSLLTLTYNKARQSVITKEISEIVSGVESMKE